MKWKRSIKYLLGILTLIIIAQIVLSASPTISSLILNATTTYNFTDDNLTAYLTVSDSDGDNISTIYDWRINDTSIAVVNMNFDVNESGGTSETKDYTTYSNNGTISGAVWNATGGLNNTGAYYFDRTSYISIADAPELDADELTVMAWINPDSTSPAEDYAIFVRKEDTQVSNGGYMLTYQATTHPRFCIHVGSTQCAQGTGITMTAGQWWHLIGWYNGSQLSLFVNGEQVANESVSGAITDNGDPVRIGGNPGFQDDFEGYIDDVKIYNRALSYEQIQEIHNNNSKLILSQETVTGNNWSVCATSNDGNSDGTTICNGSLSIIDDLPLITNIILNNTLENTTSGNLTAYAQGLYDPQGDNVAIIYDWRINGNSTALLNMNFDINNSAGTGLTKDYTTYRNDGTEINNAVWSDTAGYNGTGAYTFNGSKTYIEAGNDSAFNFQGDFTISAWIKTNDSTPNAGDGARFLSKQHVGGSRWFMRVAGPTSNIAEGRIEFETTDGDLGSVSIITDNEWHLITGVREGNVLKVYVDGALENSTDLGSASAINNIANVTIGAYEGSTEADFNGTIDNVLIFNYSVSDQQILAWYNNQTHLIVNQEITLGENWSACATPNDGTDDGVQKCSNTLTIQGSAPEITSLVLNATDNLLNQSQANLTANIEAYDVDEGTINYAHDWQIDNLSITLANFNFDVEDSAGTGLTKDYSTFGNNGTVTGAVWNATGGYNGTGAYEFVGSSSTVIIPSSDSTEILNTNYTFTLWAKSSGDNNNANVLLQFTGGAGRTLLGIDYGDSNCAGSSKVYTFLGGGASCTTYSADQNWTHYAISVIEGGTSDNVTIYINGNLSTSTLVNTESQAGADVIIGEGKSGNFDFYGTIDNVAVYNRTLSGEQIVAIYNNQTNTISSQETTKGESWSICVTPNDGDADGTTSCSNSVIIQNTPPSISSLVTNTTSGRNLSSENITGYPTSTDEDDDYIHYAYDWRKSGTSMAVVNLNFDVNNSAGTGETLDHSTYKNNGSIQGPVWNQTGGYNGTGAYYFDGLDDYIRVADTASLDPLYELTVAFWMKTNTNPVSGDVYPMVKKREASGNSYQVYIGDTGTVFGTIDTGSADTIESSTSVTDGEWHHIMFTWDGALIRLYIDGQEDTTALAKSGTMSNVGDDLDIGWRPGLSAAVWDPYEGYMDNIMVFNESLSAAFAKALYENRSYWLPPEDTTLTNNITLCITPNDGEDQGSETCSSELIIRNSLPTQGTPFLNATDSPNNGTGANLTINYVSVSDPDIEPVKNITVWQINEQSITLVDLQIEGVEPNQSNNVTDYSDYGNHGFITEDAAYKRGTTGQIGGYYQFNGVDDNIAVPTFDQGNAGALSEFSIEVWVMKDETSSSFSNTYAASQWNTGASPGTNQWALTLTNGGDNDRASFTIELGTTSYNVNWDEALNLSQWYHIVGTYDGDEMKLYVDGDLKANDSSPTGAITDRNRELRIMSNDRTSGSDTTTRGKVGLFRFYNRTLSEEQIDVLYNIGDQKIVSQETTTLENWSACVTPNDGTNDGATTCSNSLEVQNSKPTVTQLIVNTTQGANSSGENISAHATMSDDDGDSFFTNYDWRINGTSLAVINFDFENDVALGSTTDRSTYGRNGTVEGGTPYLETGGLNGSGAYDFQGSGSNDGINIGAWNITGAFSAEAWINHDDDRTWDSILTKWDNSNNKRSFGLYLTSGRLPTLCVSSDGTNGHCREATGALTTGTWHHIIATYDGKDPRNIRIYVNGVEQETADHSVSGTVTGDAFHTDTTVYIGRSVAVSGSAWYFDGEIDNVRLYNREISEEQALLLFNNRTDEISFRTTNPGENWTVCVMGNDAKQDGDQTCSEGLYVNNSKPQTTTTISSSQGGNKTSENLTAQISITDSDPDTHTNALNWYLNGTSTSLLLMDFNEYQGNATGIFNDYSGNGNNASSFYTRWKSNDGFNNSPYMEFDNGEAYLTLGDSTSMRLYNNSVSFTLWFRVSGASGTGDTFITDRNTGASGTVEGFVVGMCGSSTGFCAGSEDGRIRFFAEDGSGNYGIAQTSNRYDDGEWHHLAVSWNRTGEAAVYIDGTNVTTSISDSFLDVGSVAPTTEITIGKRPNNDQYLGGDLDDIQVWNISLTAEQVSAIYNNQTTTLVSSQTVEGENWSLCVQTFDNTEYGAQSCSATITIKADVKPTVVNLTIDPDPAEWNETVNITVNVTDDSAVGVVIFEITNPSGTQTNYTTSQGTGDTYYNDSFSSLELGTHTVKVYATDDQGSQNNSVTQTFVVACGNITQNINLTENITTTGDCFFAEANGITLDGKGFTIEGDGTGQAIDAQGFDNLIIKNFVLDDFNDAIISNGMVDSIITNNTITAGSSSQSHAILLDGASQRNNITNNTLITVANTGAGIVLDGSANNNNILYNNITTSNTQGYGVVTVDTQTDNNISYNTITTSGSSGIGIWIRGNSNDIYENNIVTSNSNAYGILLSLNSDNNNIIGNNINTSGNTAEGMYLTGAGAEDNTVQNNLIRITGTNADGILIYSSVTGTQVVQNTVVIEPAGNYGIWTSTNAQNTNITENTITSSGGSGIVLETTTIEGTIANYNTVETNDSTAISVANETGIEVNHNILTSNNSIEVSIADSAINTSMINNTLSNIVDLTVNSIRGVNIDAITIIPTIPSGLTNVSQFLNITNTSTENSSIDFNITYTDTAITNIKESSIRMYHYNTSSSQWESLSQSSVDTTQNVVRSGIVTSFSPFGPLGTELCDTYTSGNWEPGCGCTITENTDVGNNNITFSGSGNITLEANITNWNTVFISNNCAIILEGGIIK